MVPSLLGKRLASIDIAALPDPLIIRLGSQLSDRVCALAFPTSFPS